MSSYHLNPMCLKNYDLPKRFCCITESCVFSYMFKRELSEETNWEDNYQSLLLSITRNIKFQWHWKLLCFHLFGKKELLLPSWLWSARCRGTVCTKPGIPASSCPTLWAVSYLPAGNTFCDCSTCYFIYWSTTVYHSLLSLVWQQQLNSTEFKLIITGFLVCEKQCLKVEA